MTLPDPPDWYFYGKLHFVSYLWTYDLTFDPTKFMVDRGVFNLTKHGEDWTTGTYTNEIGEFEVFASGDKLAWEAQITPSPGSKLTGKTSFELSLTYLDGYPGAWQGGGSGTTATWLHPDGGVKWSGNAYAIRMAKSDA